MGKDYYTPRLVGELLNVSRVTVIDWIEKKYLKATMTAGGHYRITALEIVALARRLQREDVAQRVLAALAGKPKR